MPPQQRDRKHRHPQQRGVNKDAFDDPEAWRGLPGGESGAVGGGHHAQRDEHEEGRERIDAKSLAEREGSEANGEELEEYEDRRENDVRGVAIRRAGTALLHLEERRPGEAERRISDQQASRDSQPSISAGPFPNDACAERQDEQTIEDEQGIDEAFRGSADGHQLADRL